MAGLFGLLALGELAVAAAFAPGLGLLLLVCTGLLAGLVWRTRRAEAARREQEIRDIAEGKSEAFFRDAQTGLPNRQHLIDQLTREIARAERYTQDLTIVIVEIVRMHDLLAAWGPGVGERAVVHVADTLRRVTRNSDFLARIDDERFGIVLMQCNADQARMFGERALLAVGNRPLKPAEGARLPVYVAVEFAAAQFDAERYRGPLDFLSAAGGDIVTSPRRKRTTGKAQRKSPADYRNLRQQLVRDYYPEGKMQDFADAYKEFRSRTG
jgi:diguanylate cyclase (GGDEF)-like protein